MIRILSTLVIMFVFIGFIGFVIYSAATTPRPLHSVITEQGRWYGDYKEISGGCIEIYPSSLHDPFIDCGKYLIEK
jgi:hypothetical protein